MMTTHILWSILFQAGVTDTDKFNGYMILGYVAMWLVAMIYIFTLANRQRNVREEVELMKQLLREDEEAEE